MITIQMPIWKDYHILSKHVDDKKNKILICMTYIDSDEEKILDENKLLHIVRGNTTFDIDSRFVYCYGNVNFTTGSPDYNIIENFSFLDYLGCVGLKIYSNYDYKNHVCTSPIDRCLWTETWNPAEVAQYAHGVLGKPNKIVLFKLIKHR